MNFIKRIPPFETALVAVILVIHTYAALSDAFNLPNAWFTRDDAYYYFKVAQNITEGYGITFDGINPTNGYHPLWMLVCIPIFALARFDLILPLRVLLIVVAILNAWTAMLIYRLVSRSLAQPIAMLAAVFWAFNAYIHYTVYEFGLETPLAAFGIVLLIYSLSKFESAWRTQPVQPKQIAVLSIIATIMMFSRLDLVFLAAIVGLWIVFRKHPLRFLLPLDLVAIFASMVASFALRTGFPGYNLYVETAVLAGLLALVVKIPVFYFFSLYEHPRSVPFYRSITRIALANLTGTVLVSAILFTLTQTGIAQSFPRTALFYDFGITFALILLVRLSALWFGNRNADLSPRSENPLAELKSKWKTWLADGTIYYGILGGALAAYMLYNKIAFGTSSPVSGQIKRWWGSIVETAYDGPAPNWTSFLGISYQWIYDAWQPASNLFLWIAGYLRPLIRGANTLDERYYLAMFSIVVIALVILFINPRRVRNIFTKLGLVPLIAGSGIHILSYTTTGYAGAKEWYWISQMVLVTLLGSVLLDLITRPLLKARTGRIALNIASALASLYLVYSFADQVRVRMPYNYFPPDRPFMDVLPFLEENTPPGSVIGMTGGGNVGYFIHDRTIVNMDGLINSYDYFLALQSGTAPVYLKQKGMDIVFANPGLLALAPYNGQFAPYLERFGGYGGKALLYLLEEPKYR
ncbi:MAG: hypothetical protein HZB19_04685 [Chloroflexi bacterium]|nr:hypothetical protein [Chloroflexota bacterium]